MPMVKAPFNGQLNSNEIFSSIFNMIISQQVFADNIKGAYEEFASMFKTDGSLYGDTKLFYATDVLKSHAWGNDSEAANLLSLDRPADPKCQAITIDKFRQIRLTTSNYLDKRAWSDEGTFGSFNSVMLGWIRDTKKVYDATLVNAYLGTVKTAATKAEVNVGLSSITETGEAKNRLEAMTIGQALADELVLMGDISRDYNDYSFLRSYAPSDLICVWNSKWVNKIRKVDLPTIFNKEGILEKFAEKTLPSRYFGVIITSTNKSTYADSTPAAGKPIDSDNDTYVPGAANANGCIRSMVEKDVTISGTTYHVFPGDEIPAGSTIKASGNFELGEVYIVDENVICKLVHRDAIKYMSAFEVGTNFFNARSLTENHYLTWGYAHPDYLKNYPIVVFKAN